MIIALDIDSIVSTPILNIAALRDVSQCTVLTGAKDALDELKKLGHRILFYTNRDASLGPDTEAWLQKNKISYDGIIFNKPQYDILLDQRAHKFIDWPSFMEQQKYRLRNM